VSGTFAGDDLDPPGGAGSTFLDVGGADRLGGDGATDEASQEKNGGRRKGVRDKRRDYQRLPSLRLYVLIAQDVPRVEIYSRSDAGWRFQEVEGSDAILDLDTLGIALPLAEVDDGVPLGTGPEAPTVS
jgi:hypothetical protein